MNLFDGELWPFVALGAVLVIALVAKWLRGAAVADPHEEMRDAEEGTSFSPAGEGELVDDIQDGDDVEDEEDEEEGDDELAALGVSPDDRLEFLEGLAAHGATVLVWIARNPPKPMGFWQHTDADGTATMPVFTSEKKAYRFTRALEPRIRAKVSSFEAMSVDAAFLVEGEFAVVINARTPFETSLTDEDRRTLAALAGVEEREPDEVAVDEELPEPADDESTGYDTFGE